MAFDRIMRTKRIIAIVGILGGTYLAVMGLITMITEEFIPQVVLGFGAGALITTLSVFLARRVFVSWSEVVAWLRPLRVLLAPRVLAHIVVAGVLVAGLLSAGSELCSDGQTKENIIELRISMGSIDVDAVNADRFLRARLRSDLMEAKRLQRQGRFLFGLAILPLVTLVMTLWGPVKLGMKRESNETSDVIAANRDETSR